jgi:hypothetical protein
LAAQKLAGWSMHGMARCGSSPPCCRPPPYRGALGDRRGELAATREAIWEARWTSASTSAGDSWSRWAAPARSPARWHDRADLLITGGQQ